MKQNSAALLAALNDDNAGFFFLIRLDFNSVYFLTTLPYDFAWNGNLYQSEESVLSLESPRATTVVDRQTYKLRLSALDPALIAEVSAGILNKPVTILMGLTIDGVPLADLDDIIHVYSGTVANYKQDIGDTEQSLSIECSAPLSSLDSKSTLFTTRDAIKAFASDDTSFDQIFEGSSEYNLKWGKSS